MFVKICGITQVDQGVAIARAFQRYGMAGRCGLGFISVLASKRYVAPEQAAAIVEAVPPGVETIGVFAGETCDRVVEIAAQTALSGVQLHGNESPDYCRSLRRALPHIRLIKALRLRQQDDLAQLEAYGDEVDTYLIDAYHPQQLGGTGIAADWSLLKGFRPLLPWMLAGGLTPENVRQAIATAVPDGIDLSSGVERQPGLKDLDRVEQLLSVVQAVERSVEPNRDRSG
ncbi:phosphoribosylanthranilate isomerase [Synechococcus sp. PCC 7336]|uniref:phosphoribosylanthranilate isomerase n=1 Tax=Synechococcus sp. PCC 7336 TaxID=195250 RepID=UPI00034D0CCF|nr:phosphoribosylanthranilate isomerase [Synechococcus sp. PCC 7336]